MSKKNSAVIAVVLFVFLTIFSMKIFRSESEGPPTLKVLAYSSFLAEWGPAKELAELFEKQSGIKIEYQDGDDAGILLSKLSLFPSDVVLGLDTVGVSEAKKKFKWKVNNLKQDNRFADEAFVAFDWAPLSFIYREGEIEPPKDFDDLLSPRFVNSISLEDPRTSTPGLQFLFWLASEKGEERVADYLAKLKPNIRAISPSWSTAYGLFQKNQAKLAFSYLTSPVYHWLKEKDFRYKAAPFHVPHIFQVEYAGVTDDCKQCEAAQRFLELLVSVEAQKIIMKKNVMLPVNDEALKGSEFEKLPKVDLTDRAKLNDILLKREKLLSIWQSVKL